MATIRANLDLSRFFLHDYTSLSFSSSLLSVRASADEPRTTGLKIAGHFEEVGGIISGTISKISSLGLSDGDDTDVFGTLTISGEGLYVEDIAAFIESGVIGHQLLLSGSDELYGITKGYAGNDTFHLKEIVSISGGAGTDTAWFDQAVIGLKLDLNVEKAKFQSIEHVIGSKYDDDIRGTAGADYLEGHSGSDFLVGRAGNDILIGGSGNDRLIGSAGRDTLTGGSGKDSFVFEYLIDSKGADYDTITDFNRADDLFDLTRIDANSEKSGNQAFTWIGTSGFHGKPGELRLDIQGTRTVVRGDVDGDKIDDFRFVLDEPMKLTSLDFLL